MKSILNRSFKPHYVIIITPLPISFSGIFDVDLKPFTQPWDKFLQALLLFHPVSPVSEEVGVVDVELRLEPADGAVHQRVVRHPVAVWRSGGTTGANSNKMSVKKSW